MSLHLNFTALLFDFWGPAHSTTMCDTLSEKFNGGSATPWWVYHKHFDKYGDTVLGEPYYEKTGKYAYLDIESENEALKYILTHVVGMKVFKDKLTELADSKQ